MKRTIFLFLLIFSVPLMAEDIIETWKCDTKSGSELQIKADVFAGRKHGKIYLSNLNYSATIVMRGFSRTWFFSNGSSLEINLKNFGTYYDLTSGSIYYNCHLKN